MNPEDEGGLDLYDDILVEDLTCQQESLHEVQIKYHEALRRISVLEETARQNENDITNLKKKNTYLMKNISVLYKTACTELERKKDVIESLRNQLNSGIDYKSRMPAYPSNNLFDPLNMGDQRYNEKSFPPHDNSGQQFIDSHAFYSSHSSNYLHNPITTSNTDAHNSIPDGQSPHSSSNIPNKERSEKHPSSHSKSHNSHTTRTTESSLADNYTPPTRNTDSHNNTRESSSRSSHTRYKDEHTPHTKQTDCSVSSGKLSSSRLSSRKDSGSRSIPSKRSRTPTSSHSNNRSSSSKHSHSDSRKYNAHRSGSRTSEPHSSQSKHSESKKSGRSSRIRSKDHESSSSSSSRSRRKQSHSAEKGDTKSVGNSHRSGSSDCKYQDSRSDKQKQKATDENSATSKRKAPQEFSLTCDSKSKRKHREKSKLSERSRSQCSEKEEHLQYNSVGEEEESSKVSVRETDNQFNSERNNREDSNLPDLRYNGVHESPTIKSQDLTPETEQYLPSEATDSPIKERLVDKTSETVTESQSLESVIQEETVTESQSLESVIQEETVTESQSLESVIQEEDTTAMIARKSAASSISGNSSPKSVITDSKGDVEKDSDKGEEIEIEINEPCSSIHWAGKNLSDSDENSDGLEDGNASDVDKLESLSDTASSSKKDERSDHGSDISDNKSDSSPDHKKRSIVIKCFGGDHEDSRSPIIIPCYPSKKSKSSSSASESEEGADTENPTVNTSSKSLIARSLFPLINSTSEKSSEMCDGREMPEDKAEQKIDSALDNSQNCKDINESLGESELKQASDESQLSNISVSQPPRNGSKLECHKKLDVEYSPILEKEYLFLINEQEESSIWQNGDIEMATSSKEDSNYDDSSDDNNNENQANDCSDDELEEGEVLSDDENESVAAADTVSSATLRSPVRHKSVSPLDCRKSSSKRGREDCRKRAHREPMKSDPHNRQRSSPRRLVSKIHCPSVIGKPSRHKDDRSSRNSVYSKSGSRSQSRRLDEHPRQSEFHHKSRSRPNKKRTH